MFPATFNYNQYFLFIILKNTLRIFWYIEFFTIEICCVCLNIVWVWIVFQNMWTKSLSYFQVYYKVVAIVLENTNTIFTLCEQYYLSINHDFSTYNK
jgi:hypothetical protein